MELSKSVLELLFYLVSYSFTRFCNIWFIHSFTSLTRSHVKNDDVIKWKHFPRNWPFVRGIHRSPVNSPHKGQWRGALMFALICVWINGWVNNREAGDLRRYRAHYDAIVMYIAVTHSYIWYITVIHNVFTIYMKLKFTPSEWTQFRHIAGVHNNTVLLCYVFCDFVQSHIFIKMVTYFNIVDFVLF